ncbi:hypothetical protein INT47_007361 [Mucor saturninus]|uniref:Tc1-like transposase DDE domain-containing protein n=1 Tax=Mucor saturninus TaxID=64648 RepID=A0A8H7V075_9FUNG|nr:hypothetical protein INT47_007361 [Mucor saturninus]
MDQFIFEDGSGNLSNGQGDSVAVLAMDVDNEQYPLNGITNFCEYLDLKPPEKPVKKSKAKISEEVITTASVEQAGNNKKSYRSYKSEDKTKFFFLVYEKQLSVRAACKTIKIPASTGQNCSKKGVESLERGEDLPQTKDIGTVGRPAKLSQDHKEYLISIVDEKPDLVLEEMVEQMNSQFMDLEIGKSALHKFLTEKCQITLKRAHLYSIERNNHTKIEERYNWVKKWQETDMDFESNCVFIDEAAFHINMKRNYAWSSKGEWAIVKIPKTRAKTTTIIGAISSIVIINNKVKLPKVTAPSKKRKATIGFVQTQTDVMDQFEVFKGHYLIMDNAPIHKNQDIQLYIEGRGYKCVYLPPYSPELNPIEQFWSVVKSKLKRVALLDEETLSSRISDACNQVMIQDLKGFCRYSASKWD